MTFDAVIFDLDGTLLDTERLVLEAGLIALATHGHPADRDFMHSLIGIDNDEGARRLMDWLGIDDLSALDATWTTEIHRLYDAGIPLMPGAAELLARISQPKAVATNSRTDRARMKLERSALLPHFAAVIGYDQVALPKPAPDVFVAAAEAVGARPAHCLAFEDSDTGVAAALAAGMTVIQVPDMHHSGSAGAHHIAETLLEGAARVGLI